MRIILLFSLGVVLAFYLATGLAWLGQKLSFRKKVPIHHSELGLLLFFLGLVSLLVGDRLFPIFLSDPLNILTGTFLLGLGLGMIVHHLLSENFFFCQKWEADFATRHSHLIERILEIIPGALTWTILTSPVWLSLISPFAVAYLILLADIYWLYSACRMAVLIFIGYNRMEKAKKINWLLRLDKDFPDQWMDFYHFLVLPTYKEGLEVLKPAFDAIINSPYPAKKIFLGVGLEERDNPEKIAAVQEYLKRENKKIGGAFVTIHPYGLPGEIAGPGTNRNWVINNAVKEFKKRGIKPEQVLVTTLDADFVIYHHFLAGALHKYLSTPKDIRNKRSFTGVFLYYNNYWDCPAPTRLLSLGTAFWQLSEMVGSDKYINFSSLSMNMQSLLDVGLWIPDKINDDSGFYWKAYYYFKGNYKVIPHFLPIYGDTVLDTNMFKTFQNQYKQLQRWAYGVEHIPFIVRKYFQTTNLDFWDKTDKLLFIFWSYMKWGTLALFITFAGLIITAINPAYNQSVVSYNLPVISSYILTAAFIGLFSIFYVHEKTVPKRPANWSILQRIWSYLQWILMPLVLVTIGSIPAIDAQTRLMLGKYLEYHVTRKARAHN